MRKSTFSVKKERLNGTKLFLVLPQMMIFVTHTTRDLSVRVHFQTKKEKNVGNVVYSHRHSALFLAFRPFFETFHTLIEHQEMRD